MTGYPFSCLPDEFKGKRVLIAGGTYSRGLAKGVAPKGVCVVMITPGFIETSGAHGMITDISRGTGVSEETARQRIMDMLGGIPVGRPISAVSIT
jgi:NAD(P)-dependent dehydrogenase (short-subunit alcohol dehydrogenase family)